MIKKPKRFGTKSLVKRPKKLTKIESQSGKFHSVISYKECSLCNYHLLPSHLNHISKYDV